jgi:WD40 repeat protein
MELAVNHAGTMAASTGGDGTLRLWDVPGRRLVRTVALSDPRSPIAFSPDGKTVCLPGNHRALVFDVADGKLIRTIRNNDSERFVLDRGGRVAGSRGFKCQFSVYDENDARILVASHDSLC